MKDALLLFGENFTELFLELAPFLLLGFFLAGILHVFVPKSVLHSKLSKPGWKSSVLAALIGVPLPICSCGVLPTAVGLRKEGASKGACVSFLISTPATGVDSILATYSLLGLPFAILRPISAFLTAIGGGILTNFTTKSENKISELSSIKHASCCHNKQHENEASTCHCDSKHSQNAPTSFKAKLKEMFRYAFFDMVSEVGKWLFIGLIFGALITAFIPNDFFVSLKEYPILCMAAVLLFSMPMYTCSTGSIPLALALMSKGLPPGAAFVLLMAGPATSIASMMIVYKSFGKRTLMTYLTSIGIGAMFFGWLINTYFADLFTPLASWNSQNFEHSINLIYYGSAALLAILLIIAFVPHRKNKKSCCNKNQSHCCNKPS